MVKKTTSKSQKKSSVKRSSVKRSSVKRSPVKRSSVKRSSVKRSSVNRISSLPDLPSRSFLSKYGKHVAAGGAGLGSLGLLAYLGRKAKLRNKTSNYKMPEFMKFSRD